MRRVVLAFVALALSMLVSCKLRSLASVASFEGDIDMSTGPKSTAAIEIKGKKMRLQYSGFAAITITDADAKKTWVLDPAARTYSELELTAASKSAAPATLNVVKTGRSDTVAGYACDIYKIEDVRHVELVEACVASGLEMIAMGLGGPFSAFSGSTDAWGEVYAKGFPLRMVMLDAKGAPLVSMEATRIERKSVSDADFQIPAGYAKL